MGSKNFNIFGLSTEQVLQSRERHGKNVIIYKSENIFWKTITMFFKDPMIILLMLAAMIYFVNGQIADGVFMVIAIILVSGISLYQVARVNRALEQLKDLTQPKSKVIRNGEIMEIDSEEIVIGDNLIVEEGSSITADGQIIHSNDFNVNEAILTGESFAVEKSKITIDNNIYQGTTVTTGLAIAIITAIGLETKLGKIGKSIEEIKEEKSPLEIQIENFVKNMTIIGILFFFVVWGINYLYNHNLIDSLLKALTLAMSILPQEIPIAFTTFMALGAWRMMKKGILVKQLKTVETLGSATIICIDKTGTITENKMTLAKIFALKTNAVINAENAATDEETSIIRLAMWASEPMPFDPMEVALHKAYKDISTNDERTQYKLIHEYPLNGKPPMMTHIFKDKAGNQIIAAKGAVEALIKVCNLSSSELQEINKAVNSLTSEGYRVLGVGESYFNGNIFPKTQQELPFYFKGVVAFYDPPKKNIHHVLHDFYKAGITVKIITGDNTETTKAIARQIGFTGFENAISGENLMKLSESEFNKIVVETQIFTRMFPEAKLKIVNTLKAQNQIVAMIGDGVNDGPALKAAHIGIAMGKKGTVTAKDAASLVLVQDDLSAMIEAIGMGRRIYTNLKKAIQYIISIHIPIILIVFLPLALGWIYPNIFSPTHVIFLELIMGPTCSIVYENEPLEMYKLSQPPRPYTKTFFNWNELSISILQGLIITAGLLFIYNYSVKNAYDEIHTRSMVFTTLVTSNIFLTLANRSFHTTIFKTLKYKNNQIFIIIFATIAITASMVYTPQISSFFKFGPLNVSQIGISIFIGFVSIVWIEVFKFQKQKFVSLSVKWKIKKN